MWNLMAAKHRWRANMSGSRMDSSDKEDDDVTQKTKGGDSVDGPIKDRKLKFKDEAGDVITAAEPEDGENGMGAQQPLDSNQGTKQCNGKERPSFDDEVVTSNDDLAHHDDVECGAKKKKFSAQHALLKELGWHLGPLALLIAYCALGALVMQFLESGHEEDVRAKSLEDQNNVVQELINVTSSADPDGGNMTEMILKVIVSYEGKMHEAYSQGVTNPKSTKWTYKAALFFTATVVSTVGYGHITPVTKSGRIFCMFFAFFGIPIMLLSVTRCGQGLAKLVQLAITACKNKVGLKSSCLVSQDNKQFTIPVYFAIIFLIFYMFFGSLLFRLWETWSLLEAFYFCFITMTTIGFGDIIPEHPNFMLLCTLYLILGLAIMSMCFELAESEYVKRMKTVRRGIKEVKRFTKSVKIKSTSRTSLSSGKIKSSNSYEVTGQDSREISRDDQSPEISRDVPDDGVKKDEKGSTGSVEKVSAL